MNIPDEAIAGACVVLCGELPCTDPTCKDGCPSARKVAAALEAALPHIEKEIRAQVASELRGELPVKLGETAASEYGWLSDLQYVSPKTSAGFEMVELSYVGGSIDISHIAEHAATIAEGVDHA